MNVKFNGFDYISDGDGMGIPRCLFRSATPLLVL